MRKLSLSALALVLVALLVGAPSHSAVNAAQATETAGCDPAAAMSVVNAMLKTSGKPEQDKITLGLARDYLDTVIAACNGGTPAATAEASDTGGWQYRESKSAVDDTLTQLVYVTPEPNSFFGTPPELVVRCQGKTWDTFLDSGTTLLYEDDYNQPIVVRFDDTQAVTVTANQSTTRAGLFFPKPQTFIGHILDAKKVVIQFTDYNSRDITPVFDVTGLDAAMKPLIKNCGELYK